MIESLVLLLFVTSILVHVSSTTDSSTSSSTCSDDANYKYNGSDDLTCTGLRRTETLRLKYCPFDEVAKACQVACGICCHDDLLFRFKLKGKVRTSRNCSWIGETEWREKKYCFNFKEKNEIKAACPSACGLCRDPVTVDPWSFIVLADWHKADYFAAIPGRKSTYYKETFSQIKYIKKNYGGDLVVLPGDTNGALPSESGGGKWDTREFSKVLRPDMNIRKRVNLAGKNCYKTVRDLFTKSGYPLILVALGDHEIGGNRWGKLDRRKMEALPAYHGAFERWYNTDYIANKQLQSGEKIGSAPSRPEQTEYENSSFAHRHKNVLFVSVNSFKQMDENFLDREHGLGGEGIITCTVDGEHLQWFTNVLREARKDASIRHIIVQSHVPVIQPVRKVACSGQFMDNGEESLFWKIMVKYDVDVYLAGEVHANTATKDPDSNLVQIVSRGNQFSNFLRIEVTANALNITSYNEVGTKRFNNMNYEVHGRLLIDKSDCSPLGISTSSAPSAPPSTTPTSSPSCLSSSTPLITTNPTASISTAPASSPTILVSSPLTTLQIPPMNLSLSNGTDSSSQSWRQPDKQSSTQHLSVYSNYSPCEKGVHSKKAGSLNAGLSSANSGCGRTVITASGVLELLDRTSALIHFNFEEILPLGSRQVIGLQHDDHTETLVAKCITIRGVKCKESLPNLGTFAQLYDAQIANISLIRQRSNRGRHHAKFTKDSRFGIFGNGPHTPGQPVSFGIWINVSMDKEMIIVHYGNNFMGKKTKKDNFTLTLNKGIPRLYTSPTGILIPKKSIELNDNEWYHIIVSMPRQNCKLSEVTMYINGDNIQTMEPVEDDNIFFTTSGRLSIGGFGHSNHKFESIYPHLSPLEGLVDEFSLWTRPIEADDFPLYT